MENRGARNRRVMVALGVVLAACDHGSSTVRPDAELGTASLVAVDEPVRITFRRSIDAAHPEPATIALRRIHLPVRF